MSTTACALLRHDIRPRWIGDLLAAFCHTCGCLVIPEPIPALADRIPPSVGQRLASLPGTPVLSTTRLHGAGRWMPDPPGSDASHAVPATAPPVPTA